MSIYGILFVIVAIAFCIYANGKRWEAAKRNNMEECARLRATVCRNRRVRL